MKNKLALTLSATALAVAVFAATPVGEAGKRLVIPRNSVGPVQIKVGAVNAKHIARGAVTGIKVRTGTLLASHFKPGELVSGAPGAQGPPGPVGPVGPTSGQATKAGGSVAGATAVEPKLEVKMTVAGSLFVIGRVESSLSCGASECRRHYVLYLDGAEVPGTLATAFAPGGQSVREHLAVFGVKALGAGTHTLEFRAINAGPVTGAIDAAANVGAIVLGS